MKTVLQNKKNIRLKILSAVLGLLILGLLSLSLIIEFKKEDLSPEDSSAIYGGQVENNLYPFAGYLMAYTSQQKGSVCGLTYLSKDIAVTAAHCVDDKAIAYLGYSLFNFSIDQNFLAEDFFVNPEWQGKNVSGDIAIVKVPDEFFDIEGYAVIGSPETGCDYEVLGYGKTEDDDSRSKLEKLRKKSGVCIEEISTHTFIVRGQNGGVCYGDSGSPIFKKGTNELIGVLSSIRTSASESKNGPCSMGNRANAVRVDEKIGFISSVEENSFVNDELSICGERCSDDRCSFGLSCNEDEVCVGIHGTCIANNEDYCSVAANLNCENNQECVLNKCESRDIINTFTSSLKEDLNINLSDQASEFRKYLDIRQVLIYGVLGLVVALVTIKFYEYISSNFSYLKLK